MSQRLLQQRLQTVQLLGGRCGLAHQIDRDGIARSLHKLILAQVRDDLPKTLGLQHRPEGFAFRAQGHVPDSSHDASQSRQAAAAGAGWANLRPVTQRVADKGHSEVVQISDDYLADFTFPARLAFFIDYLHQQMLRLQMQQIALRALQANDADFLCAVQISQRHAQRSLACLTQSRRDYAADGAYLPQARQRDTVAAHANHQGIQIGRIGQQDVGINGLQPAQLFVDIR